MVADGGLELEFADCPGDGVGEGAELGGADVVEFDGSGGVSEGKEHGIDAVGYIEVAVAESGVAGDVEVAGMVAELAAELEQMAMGLALADHGGETEEESAEAVGMGVGGDEGFGGQFGGAQECGLDGQPSGFRGRRLGVGTVEAGGAGIDEGGDAMSAHRFEDIPGDDNVLVEVSTRKLGAVVKVGVRGEMEDGVDALAGLGDGGEVEQIAEDQLKAGGGGSVSQELPLAGDEVIDADYFVAFRKQAVHRMTTQKPGGAGDEKTQTVTL